MKLLTKTSLIYLLVTALIFACGGIVFYYNLRSIVDDETTEKLYIEKKQVEDFVKLHQSLPDTSITSGDIISFFSVAKPVKAAQVDTTMYSRNEDEDLPYRTVIFPVKAGTQLYAAHISKPMIEADDLTEGILKSFFIIVVILLVVTLIVNRFIIGRLWKPFFSTVEKLKVYDLSRHKSFEPENVNTAEFHELNLVLKKMTGKIEADYNNLKSFTENASHELQTPLAVILSSTELLLQQENLTQKQFEQVQQVNQTANRLAKLNQTLLLLAKIENRQFERREKVDVAQLLKSKLELYDELIHHKGIAEETSYFNHPTLLIHPVLADILISNLIINAIRHTPKNGLIQIELHEKKLLVCNSGEPMQSNGEKIFERFYKEDQSSESTGLGLALVKQIADTNGLTIAYAYRDNMHCFVLNF